MKNFFLSVIAVTLCSVAHGQSKVVIDSLEEHLTTSVGVDRARILYELANYYSRVDIQKAKLFVEKADALSTAKNPGEQAFGLLAKGVYLGRTGSIDQAIQLYERARDAAREDKNDAALMRALAALAYANIQSGKPAQGLQNLFDALRVEERSPEAEMEYKLRTNIVWAYLELKQFENAIAQGRDLLSDLSGSEYEWIAMYSYNNLAVCFGATGQVDSARFYIDKGIAAAQRVEDNQHIANAHFILGNIYAEAGKFDEAVASYLRARPFREKVGNPFFIVSDLYTLSDLYYQQAEYKKGIETAKEALRLAEQFDLTMKFEGAFLALAKNYQGAGDFKNASKYFQRYASAKDSVYKNSSAEAIAEMQTRFDTEKKEQQLVLQRAEIDKKQAVIERTYAIIALLAITLVLTSAIFVLVRGRLKRKQLLLEQEKELYIREAQIQASIQSQERERKRFAQDLHDSMGQLISALRLALHNLHKGSSMEERVDVVNKAELILNEMYREIRGIAFNLMPQTLVQERLIPAVREMANRLNGSGKIVVNVSSLDMPTRLPEVQEISIYRVIQEWVNNVIKYANASLIEIQLIAHEEEITITIEDNGKGFDTQVLHNSTGNGWKNIKSRMNLIKATVEVDSKPGISGATLIIQAPRVLQQTSGHISTGSTTVADVSIN